MFLEVLKANKKIEDIRVECYIPTSVIKTVFVVKRIVGHFLATFGELVTVCDDAAS